MAEDKDLNNSLKIEQEKYYYNLNIESFKALLESGKNAMRAPMLINSGASIAMLTFITKLMADENISLAKDLSLYLALYVIGVFCAAVSYGITYFTQLYNYKVVEKLTGKIKVYDRKSQTIGKRINIISMILVFASFTLFAYSSLKFYCFIQSYQIS
ncbi:hypothetical protein FA592_12265 [Sulfurospirillum diekertiae]|uniref:Uncharacterized protein n=1 Tax=Sulfurospirillum diekertiae TaxID=1854492 RepID=A0A6G9VVD4_9BACT|nr:hypothetical protein [Sulfurospirillum diekertiae]QIR76967.1 hypothetical protein FA584_12475 [Sulfurospirillum diekertiae]QIR79583.1 hypothetical protein FA592_12265 [Sulfurospirillum diekertiae]